MYFGHVAIWTGTKAEVIDAGVWADPVVQRHAEHISNESDPHSRDEHQIIEALRNGVKLSTLDHFLNVDDVAILRPVFPDGAASDMKREALLLAFRQVGKQYDFNFDVNTTDKIVCSELAYVSFPSTEKMLGRHSISPNNAAELAGNNFPLEAVMFYHDGELVEPSAQRTKIKELMAR